MKERLTTLLAWLGFLCLLFGVLPLGAMAMGYQLEAMQDNRHSKRFPVSK